MIYNLEIDDVKQEEIINAFCDARGYKWEIKNEAYETNEDLEGRPQDLRQYIPNPVTPEEFFYSTLREYVKAPYLNKIITDAKATVERDIEAEKEEAANLALSTAESVTVEVTKPK